MMILSQQNSAWAKMKLGFSQQTIGNYGCAITCLAMWLNHIAAPEAANYDPIVINTTLRANADGFVNRNFLNWRKLPDIWPMIKYSGRIDCPTIAASAAQLHEIDRRLDRDVPVILYVDSSRQQPGLQQHFVLAERRDERQRYIILDPWYGDRAGLTPRYGLTKQHAVCGAILLDVVK